MSAAGFTLLAICLDLFALAALVVVLGQEWLLPGQVRHFRRRATMPPIAAPSPSGPRFSPENSTAGVSTPPAALLPAFPQAFVGSHGRDCKGARLTWRGVLFPERRRNEK